MPILTFRTCNHLPVETGRWLNILREDRRCNSPAIADEFHYIFRCKAFEKNKTIVHPREIINMAKLSFKILLCTKNLQLKKLSKFITIICESV